MFTRIFLLVLLLASAASFAQPVGAILWKAETGG